MHSKYLTLRKKDTRGFSPGVFASEEHQGRILRVYFPVNFCNKKAESDVLREHLTPLFAVRYIYNIEYSKL